MILKVCSCFFIWIFVDEVKSALNTEVVLQATVLLSLAAVFQISDGLQVTAAGALRGLKDTRTPMLVAVISYWCVGLTSGYVLGFQLGFEGAGLWWGLVIGLTTAALLLSWRFNRKIKGLLFSAS